MWAEKLISRKWIGGSFTRRNDISILTFEKTLQNWALVKTIEANGSRSKRYLDQKSFWPTGNRIYRISQVQEQFRFPFQAWLQRNLSFLSSSFFSPITPHNRGFIHPFWSSSSQSSPLEISGTIILAQRWAGCEWIQHCRYSCNES